MLKRLRAPFGLLFSVLALSGCSSITGPQMVTDFDWGEVQDPETIVEGVTTSVFLGDLLILGQFNTPTRCYELASDFKRKEKTLTIRVAANSNQSPNCDERLGGFRYTASVANLKHGTYDLKILHVVGGDLRGEYTETVTIR